MSIGEYQLFGWMDREAALAQALSAGRIRVTSAGGAAMDATIVRERRAELREAAEWLLDKLDSPDASHLTLSRAYRLVHNTGLRWDAAVIDLNRQNMLPVAVVAPLPGDE